MLPTRRILMPGCVLFSILTLNACGGDGTAERFPQGYLLTSPLFESAILQAEFQTEHPSATRFQKDWTVTQGWRIEQLQDDSGIQLIPEIASVNDELHLKVSDYYGAQARGRVSLPPPGSAAPLIKRLLISARPIAEALRLEAGASDPQSSPLQYDWLYAGASVASGARATWTPGLAGQYRIDLQVSNGQQTSLGQVDLNYTGYAAWPFFLGNRQGIGSLYPQSTSGMRGALNWEAAFTSNHCSVSTNFQSAIAMAADGTLYIGSAANGRLYALSALDGHILWSFQTDSASIAATPVVAADGTIYVSGYDSGHIYALDPDGQMRWRYATGTQVTAAATIGPDGSIYVGTLNGVNSVLIALNPDGTEKWAAPFALADTTRSAVNFGDQDTLYVRDYSGRLYAVDARDGSERWQILLGGFSGASPIVDAEGTIYISSFTGNASSRFYAVTPDGQLKWESDLDGYLNYGIGASASVDAEGTVYIASWENGGWDGAVYALDAETGQVNWRFDANAQIQSSMALSSDGTLYVATKERMFYALNAVDGSERWHYELDVSAGLDTLSPPSIGRDGNVYVYACDGILRAFH